MTPPNTKQIYDAIDTLPHAPRGTQLLVAVHYPKRQCTIAVQHRRPDAASPQQVDAIAKLVENSSLKPDDPAPASIIASISLRRTTITTVTLTTLMAILGTLVAIWMIGPQPFPAVSGLLLGTIIGVAAQLGSHHWTKRRLINQGKHIASMIVAYLYNQSEPINHSVTLTAKRATVLIQPVEYKQDANSCPTQ